MCWLEMRADEKSERELTGSYEQNCERNWCACCPNCERHVKQDGRKRRKKTVLELKGEALEHWNEGWRGSSGVAC